MPHTAPHALIVGGGIAGLSAAIALNRAGWRISLFEQADQLVPMGAALSLWPNAFDALAQLGRADAVAAVAQPLRGVALARMDGTLLGSLPVSKSLPGRHAHMVTRTALQSALLDGLDAADIHLGHRLESWSQDADAVGLRFTNGVEAVGDLLVAADGIWSAIARDVTGVSSAHAGYGGVLALSGAIGPSLAMGSGVEHWGQGERVGLFDIPDGRTYWFYMKNERTAAESAAITLDAIKHHMVGWPDRVQAAICATAADALVPFSIHAKPPPKRLGHGRVVLTGDAAHAMEPNLGQGACQAIEDAVALGAAAAARDVTRILAPYERARLVRAAQFVTLSRRGAMVAHRMPQWLTPVARVMIRRVMGPLAHLQMRRLFTLPDYRGDA